MADGKSKSEAPKLVPAILGEDTAVVVAAGAEKDRSSGMVKPCADEDHEANKSSAN